MKTNENSLDQKSTCRPCAPSPHEDMKANKSGEDTSEEQRALYTSLLGAIARTLLTRKDICMFVSALQRWSQKPKVIHTKRLQQ